MIADPSWSLHYMIDSESMAGDFIKSTAYSNKYFAIEFEEIHRLEESGECTNYGDGTEFKTYADCVANEQEKLFRPLLGCMVPWLAAPNNPDICKGRLQISKNLHDLFLDNFNDIYRSQGFKVSDYSHACLKPCLQLQAKSKQKSTEYGVMESGISLNFKKTVKVTRYMESYGLFDLVVEMGSSLGLWIGLSALGIFDLLLEAGDAIKKKLSIKKKFPTT